MRSFSFEKNLVLKGCDRCKIGCPLSKGFFPDIIPFFNANRPEKMYPQMCERAYIPITSGLLSFCCPPDCSTLHMVSIYFHMFCELDVHH